MSVTADAMQAMRTGDARTILDYGDRALLLQFGSTAEVLAWTDALRRAELPGVVDLVPAARTVLVKLVGAEYQAPTRQRLSRLQPSAEAIAASAAPGDGHADVVL